MALYPPVVASSMPAFNINDKQVRVYFTLSSYNSKSAIALAQISVRRQSSNVNVLVNKLGVVSKPLLQDSIDIALNRYYVTIFDSDILKKEASSSGEQNEYGFEANVLYKVQIRLSSSENTGKDDYLTTEFDQFSEWSTVCIIKPIVAPTFYISEFTTQGVETEEEDNNLFYYPFADFTGVYQKGNSTLVLKTWRLRLLNSTYTKNDILNIDDYTLADSGIVAISAYNYTLDNGNLTFLCKLPYVFFQQGQGEQKYKLFFEIVTKNDYEGSFLYSFEYKRSTSKIPQGEFKSFINEEEGYIKVSFTLDDIEEVTVTTTNNFVLRRADSKNNFSKWEDLIYFKMQKDDTFVYYDFTAESGILYKYCIQYVDPRGRRYNPNILLPLVMALWLHAFLLESNTYGQIATTKQLKLKFDFQISSYKTNIAESKTDTIGGRYPYIRRNGNMYYRSFPCSGTITGYMDNAELFISKDKVLDYQTTAYNAFQGELYSKFVNKYDYTYERKFREYVELFLYNIKPKLYKSMQEGNILIKLMDVSLTPKQLLGRLIYTFSATAYEIDAPILSNFNRYDIIHIGDYDPNLGEWIVNTYQIDGTTVTDPDFVQQIISDPLQVGSTTNTFKAGQDIIGTGSAPAANSIAAINNYGVPDEDTKKVITNMKFKGIRIEVESDPYLIVSRDGGLRPLEDGEEIGGTDGASPIVQKRLYQMESTLNGLDIYLGTLFKINGNDVIIAPPNNIYEIKEDDLNEMESLSIVPAKDTNLTVNYVVNLFEQVADELIEKINKTVNINAQLDDSFTKDDDIINIIRVLYKQDYELDEGRVVKELSSVKTISVDTDPGVKVEFTTKKLGGLETPVTIAYINDTGLLLFDVSNDDTNSQITSFKFTGIRIPAEKVTELTSQEEWNKYKVNYDYYDGKIFYKNKVYDVTISLKDNEPIFYLINDSNFAIHALVFYYAVGEEKYY